MCHIYSNVCCKRHLDQAAVFCCDYTALVHVVEVWFCVMQCISYLSVFSIHWHVLSCLIQSSGPSQCILLTSVLFLFI